MGRLLDERVESAAGGAETDGFWDAEVSEDLIFKFMGEGQ